MRIHLAGCELAHFAKMVVETGHKYILMSYYHFFKNSPDQQKAVVKLFNDNDMQVIVDSGLFTMMFGAGKGGRYDLQFMTDYTHKYIGFVKSLGIKNCTLVECDVHKILGMPAVFELRKYFEDAGLDTIYVWHREEEIEGLLTMAKRYNYIAISVPELRILFKEREDKYQAAVFDLLARIRANAEQMPRIHLLGNTVEETMKTQLAYSCDSTSYLAGVKYGQAVLYYHGKIKKVSLRSQAFADMKKSAVDERLTRVIDSTTEKINFREYLKNVFLCARAYEQYQHWLDRNYQWCGGKNVGD